MAALLEISNLHAFYGKSHVLHGVNLRVEPGEIVSLLGRNGVGRSTTVKAAMGQVAATGAISFKGDELIGLKAFPARRGAVTLVRAAWCGQRAVPSHRSK